MSNPIPPPAIIEIIERGASYDPDKPLSGVIAPNEIRINGIPLLATDAPIKVHEMELSSSDLVCVTLTLIARRVFIGLEGDLPVSENTASNKPN